MKELFEIQQKLKAPKSQFNKFGNYKYRNLEDILEAVKPILKELKCVLMLSDSLENIGSKNYVKSTATLFTIEGKEIASNYAYAREAEIQKGMNDSQITGSTSSYCRKYALNGLFSIDDTKDSDNTNTHGKEEIVKKGSEVELEAKALIKKKLGSQEKLNNFLKASELPAIKDCTDKEFSIIIDLLNVEEK